MHAPINRFAYSLGSLTRDKTRKCPHVRRAPVFPSLLDVSLCFLEPSDTGLHQQSYRPPTSGWCHVLHPSCSAFPYSYVEHLLESLALQGAEGHGGLSCPWFLKLPNMIPSQLYIYFLLILSLYRTPLTHHCCRKLSEMPRLTSLPWTMWRQALLLQESYSVTRSLAASV